MKSDYYICFVDKNGDGRKTIFAHVYELNGNTRGKLLREIG